MAAGQDLENPGDVNTALHVPDDVAEALRLMVRDPAGAALEAIALEAFREHRITAYQLRNLDDLDLVLPAE